MNKGERNASVGLIGWSLFMWGTRVPLLWKSSEVEIVSKLVQSIPIVGFTACAIASATELRLDREPRFRKLLALGTLIYWPVRLGFILLNDQRVGFKVVHSLLATVSCVAAVFVLRSLRSARSGSLRG